MKRFTSLLSMSVLITASLCSPGWAARSTESFEPKDATTDQLIVSIDKGFSIMEQSDEELETEHLKALEQDGFKVIDSLLDSKPSNVRRAKRSTTDSSDAFKEKVVENMGYVYLVEYPQQMDSPDVASQQLKEKLSREGYDVRYIEPNQEIEALDEVSPAAMHEEQKWQYDMIRATDTWKITKGDKSIKVAVLDTGIDYNHEALANLVDTTLGATFISGTDTPMDDHGHGTHVAGTIASYGSVSGVTDNTTLIPVKVLASNGKGSTYGIQQAVLHSAKVKADIINMSLGGGSYSQGMEEACKLATDEGVIIFAASGNEKKTHINYPAAYPDVIAVGAVDSNKQRAKFSNYGTGLELMAPGVGIYSTTRENTYGKKNGTSMATPHVAGVAALMRSVNKTITPQEVREILKDTAVPAGDQNEYGYGIVDAYAAVIKAGGVVPPEVAPINPEPEAPPVETPVEPEPIDPPAVPDPVPADDDLGNELGFVSGL